MSSIDLGIGAGVCSGIRKRQERSTQPSYPSMNAQSLCRCEGAITKWANMSLSSTERVRSRSARLRATDRRCPRHHRRHREHVKGTIVWKAFAVSETCLRQLNG